MRLDTKKFLQLLSDDDLKQISSEIAAILDYRKEIRGKSPEALIETVGLGKQALRILEDLGIKRISDLQYYTRKQIGMQRNWGKICFHQLDAAMEDHKVEFKPEL